MDEPGTHDDALFVEDRCLPCGHSERRPLELETESAPGLLDRGPHRLRSVAEFHVRALHWNVQPARGLKRGARERFARADDDGVRARVRPKRVERFRS